jgi:NTP pyrophosphatase (non-canonical NTP hydrolase)
LRFSSFYFYKSNIEEDSMNNKQLDLFNELNENKTLREVQEYIKKVIEIRGFNKQPPEQTMLLLTEEVGELAKAIRKDKTKMCIDNNKINNYDTIESEVADVFIVLSTICNELNIDLYSAVKNKEKENINRKWS